MFANQFFEKQRLVLTGSAVLAQQVASDKWAVFAPATYRRGQTVTVNGKYLGTADYFALPASVPKGSEVSCSQPPTIVGEVIATSGDWKLVTDFKALVYEGDVATYEDKSPMPKLDADYPADWGSAIVVERPTGGNAWIGVVASVPDTDTVSEMDGYCVVAISVPGAGRGARIPAFITPAGTHLLAKVGSPENPISIDALEADSPFGAIVGKSRHSLGAFPAAIAPGTAAYPNVDAIRVGNYSVRNIATPWESMVESEYKTITINGARFKLHMDHLEVTADNLDAFKAVVAAAGAALREAVARLRNPREHEVVIGGLVYASVAESDGGGLVGNEELRLSAVSSAIVESAIDDTAVDVKDATSQGSVCLIFWDGDDELRTISLGNSQRVYAADDCVGWWDVEE